MAGVSLCFQQEGNWFSPVGRQNYFCVNFFVKELSFMLKQLGKIVLTASQIAWFLAISESPATATYFYHNWKIGS